MVNITLNFVTYESILCHDYCLDVMVKQYLHKCDVDRSDSQHKKASNHHVNLPLEMYSFTL